MSLSLDTAVNNLSMLRSFVVGDKPVTDKETLEIMKENRFFFVWLRRKFCGFNTNVLESTFAATLPFLKATEIKIYDPNKPEEVKKQEEVTQSISLNFQPALAAVLIIIETYRNEKKEQTAHKIQIIYDRFKEEYDKLVVASGKYIPFPPPLPPLNGEKRKFAESAVRATTEIAKAHSKKITAAHANKYEQDLHAELKLKLTMPLKKVDRGVTTKSYREATPYVFNVSLKQSIRKEMEVPTDDEDKEWNNNSNETKPPLLRTQSEFIPRPVANERQLPHAAKLMTNRRINVQSVEKSELQKRMDFFAGAMAKRRKDLRESPEAK